MLIGFSNSSGEGAARITGEPDEWQCDASNATFIVDHLEELGLAPLPAMLAISMARSISSSIWRSAASQSAIAVPFWPLLAS
jgi:hypothetical protein